SSWRRWRSFARKPPEPEPEPKPEPQPDRDAPMAETFDHERLTVYQIALEFVEVADAIIQALPPKRAYLADQLQRAATSIVLNIAEVAGEFSKKEKARFYRMAQRSTTESAGLLDVSEH